jgi:pyruvate/2-oxoglutarate dehydrogenase complex dihydrolipoamide dehydrogenase (E3) component
MHLDNYKASGAELAVGEAHFIAPRTVEIRLNSGGVRSVAGDRIFLDLGTRAALPDWLGRENEVI